MVIKLLVGFAGVAVSELAGQSCCLRRPELLFNRSSSALVVVPLKKNGDTRKGEREEKSLIGVNSDFRQFRKVEVHARAWREEKKGERRREKRRKEKRNQELSRTFEFGCGFRQGFNPTRCNFELNLIYSEVINDPKCLGKELSEIKGFRGENGEEKSGNTWEGLGASRPS
uniref:Uncharacterized protein n=1 Tax=Solanum tuberosum TaxID=4113 RepID=M1DXY4_SOLTU